jgi:hypothetical protein
MPCKAADAKSSRRMFEETILPRFGTPRLVISDGDLISLRGAFDAT